MDPKKYCLTRSQQTAASYGRNRLQHTYPLFFWSPHYHITNGGAMCLFLDLCTKCNLIFRVKTENFSTMPPYLLSCTRFTHFLDTSSRLWMTAQNLSRLLYSLYGASLANQHSSHDIDIVLMNYSGLSLQSQGFFTTLVSFLLLKIPWKKFIVFTQVGK